MPDSLASVTPLSTITDRLRIIFPEGTPHRNYCVREVAARTVWVMLYAGALEGAGRWLRPSMVTDMSDRQARRLADAERNKWYRKSEHPGRSRSAGAWFAPNSREQIRDETLRLGLIPNGAVIERKGLPTTSPAPRYALSLDFAALLKDDLAGEKLNVAIEKWRKAHLSKAALARVTLMRKGAVKTGGAVTVTFPSGHSRTLAPGPSSDFSKALVEEFAPRYLVRPAVLWLSESASKVRDCDDELAASLGLRIDATRNLPDLILIDVGTTGADFLVVFAEVVATDGPVNESRKKALLAIAQDAGFDARNIAFLTVYRDRGDQAFRRSVADLALGSFIWFMAEPDSLLILREGKPVPLSTLR